MKKLGKRQFISNGRFKWGGDIFSNDLSKTYEELYNIVIYQEYINKFVIYEDEMVVFDYNLNNFRYSPYLWSHYMVRIIICIF